MKKLSILICSLTSRIALRERLLASLLPQLTPEVEVLTEEDEGKVTIGEKRNRLLSIASGEYVCFVDDDDLVSEDYVKSIFEGIDKGVDVVSIRGMFTTNGSDPHPFIDCPYQGHAISRIDGKMEFLRGVQHLDAIKREIAVTQKFPLSSHGEDYDWGTAIERSKIVKTWHRIDHPVYFYDFRTDKKWSGSVDLAVVMPVYNHVYMTAKCVDSLLANTSDPNFVLILVDDGSTDDMRDFAMDASRTLGTRFHYQVNPSNLGVNPSWNIGVTIARARGAKNIAIVNNDLMFGKDWDAPLVRSLEEHPEVGIISPLSTMGQIPLDWPKGLGRDVNPAGYRGYMPILGACFMARTRTLVEIGPIPVELKMYFGDNWLAMKAQSLGYECGYDGESYVHHHCCVTTSGIDSGPYWEAEGPAYEALEKREGIVMKPFAPKEEPIVEVCA